MKILLVMTTMLLVQLMVSTSIMSQAQKYSPIEELRKRSMTGEVYFLPFFVDTQFGEFEEDEIEYYLKELRKSKDWIIEEAKVYKEIELEITDDFFDSHEEVVLLNNVKNWNRGGNHNLKNDIAEYLGYESIIDYIDFNNIDLNEIKVAVLCFVKRNGRSHAYDFNRSIFSEDLSDDHSIIFCSSKNGFYTDYKTISHEILHMFGAWDFYQGEPQNPTKAKELKKLYPNSIMGSTYNIDTPNIDELNAWRLGWNMSPKKFFYDYKPEYRKNMKTMEKNKNPGKKYIIGKGN